MRRGITLAFLGSVVAIVLLAAVPALAAPAAQTVGIITSPKPGSTVRGTVPIEGSASHPDFWKYEVHYGRGANPSQWVLIGDVHQNKVTNGRLEMWNTGLVPDGQYTLRLRVVRKDGNYEDFYARDIRVANTTPTETPTPEATIEAPPTPTSTPLPATPTVVIEQPKRETPTVIATVTRPAVVPSATPPNLPSISGGALIGAAWSGAKIVLIAFAVVAALAIARWVLWSLAKILGKLIRRKLLKQRDEVDD